MPGRGTDVVLLREGRGRGGWWPEASAAEGGGAGGVDCGRRRRTRAWVQTRACSHTCSAKEEGRRGDEDRVRKNAVGEKRLGATCVFLPR